LVLLDRNPEFDPGGVFFHFGLMIFNEFYNASSILLAVFLCIHKDGPSNEVFRIEDGGGWWLCIELISESASRFGLIHGGSIFKSSNMERTPLQTCKHAH
jgi:hypothetical protein